MHVDYSRFPRLVGNPYSRFVHSKAEFDAFIAENDGKFACFTSHNALPTIREVVVQYIPFDFDSEEKPENALADTLALTDWAKEKNLQVISVYSGKKGFHSYAQFRPLLTANNGGLKRAYRAFQLTALSEAKLRTADKSVFGQPARLMRIVGSRHQKTQRYCVEIPPDMLKRADIDEIVSYSSEPRRHLSTQTPQETFAEAVARLRPNFHAGRNLAYDRKPVPYKPPDSVFTRRILPRACVHTEIMTNNPQHLARVEAASWLVRLGFDYDWICNFINDVAEDAGWVDRNPEITAYQVARILEVGGYSPRSCENIRADSYCVGLACKLFKMAFPKEGKDAPN